MYDVYRSENSGHMGPVTIGYIRLIVDKNKNPMCDIMPLMSPHPPFEMYDVELLRKKHEIYEKYLKHKSKD